MATIRADDETHAKLVRFRGMLEAETGKPVSLSEAISFAIEVAIDARTAR